MKRQKETWCELPPPRTTMEYFSPILLGLRYGFFPPSGQVYNVNKIECTQKISNTNIRFVKRVCYTYGSYNDTFGTASVFTNQIYFFNIKIKLYSFHFIC